MKSKLRSRFQWGGGKSKGAFPTSKAKYVDVDTPSINVTPKVRDGPLNLNDCPEIHTAHHGNVTVSTLSNNDGAFSQKRFNCGFDSDERSTMREEMWYKNQVYLKGAAVKNVSVADIASRYASDKRWNQYDDDEGSDAAPDAPDSPVGVSELDSFNRRLARRSDSETYTCQSSSMVDATESSSVYDDDGTRSTFFYSESGTEDDTNFEDVTLGTIDTSTSTRYEMDDGAKSKKKYKLGYGTTSLNQRSMDHVRSRQSRSRSPPPSRRRRAKSYSKDDASTVADVNHYRCPFPMANELRGTFEDFSLTVSQVMHAFFISPDDVDKMSDKIRDAGYDLRDLHEAYKFKASLPSRR